MEGLTHRHHLKHHHHLKHRHPLKHHHLHLHHLHLHPHKHHHLRRRRLVSIVFDNFNPSNYFACRQLKSRAPQNFKGICISFLSKVIFLRFGCKSKVASCKAKDNLNSSTCLLSVTENENNKKKMVKIAKSIA